jgi:phosphoglycerate-specific signal transduction histidine kinase
VEPEDRNRRLVHEVSQPLNVINLAVANLRNVLGEGLSPEQSVYLGRKLDRIDQQTERVRAILEGLPG